MKVATKIIAFHLLNDRSGSPKVLSQILKHWSTKGYQLELYTSRHDDGFLSDIQGVKYHSGWYVFQSNPWVRLVYFIWSQILLMVRMWNNVNPNDIIYINTVLPFGAAILGKWKGARVIYHIHESNVNPKVLTWFLFNIVKWTASDIINVSDYVQQAHNISSVKNHLIYNAIEDSYLENLKPKALSENPKNVLMVCSLKKYKGVFEFLQLAQDHPQCSFQLVLNASQVEIDSFFKNTIIPSNLTLYPSQKDLHPFYQWADVIVNLSCPDGWIEKFGLTIIEAMAYGLPSIVPPVGGILEVIEEGVTGYAVDSRDKRKLNETLNVILNDNSGYTNMSLAAKARLKMFTEREMMMSIDNLL